jgi:hypothetical protein
MGNLKPVIAVAALMAAIVGEGWLRSNVHQFDEDYVGLADLIGRDAQARRGGQTRSLRQLPNLSTRSYRGASSWLSGSETLSLEGQPGQQTSR